jgi:4'-phosphopantetheinyl transferase
LNIHIKDGVVVHLYRWGAGQSRMAAMLAQLSADEQIRAAGFRFERDRYQFILCRHLLRAALAEACSITPDQVEFDYGPQGRPRIRGMDGSIDFNISHADGIAAIAISAAGRVGIDLEPEPITDLDHSPLADTVLTVREREELSNHSPNRRTRRFLEYWTAKEAFLKLDGLGLSVEPRHLEVMWRDEYCRCALLPGLTGPPPAILTRLSVPGAICTLATPATPDTLTVLAHGLP